MGERRSGGETGGGTCVCGQERDRETGREGERGREGHHLESTLIET